MARLDKYFPLVKDSGENSNESVSIDMDKLSEVIQVKIDNALKSAINKINEKENENNGVNTKNKQGTVEEGEVSVNNESGNTDHPEA